jgi:hypothetical protein
MAAARETTMRIILTAAAVLIGAALSSVAAEPPTFKVDASWPQTLPNNWIMGQAAGVAVDADDNVWVIQRPRTLTDDEKAASFNPPRTKCCVPPPPVMEFDANGKLLRAWGRTGAGL